MLMPEKEQFKGFGSFYYSTTYFHPQEHDVSTDGPDEGQRMNIDLWRKRCRNVPSVADVHAAIYLHDEEIFDPQSNNGFMRYLYAHKDDDAIAYLKFAVKCSSLNTHMDDPWERYEHVSLPHRTKLIEEAKERIKVLKDEDLRLRYAFLAIRLAYYNRETSEIDALYNEHFRGRSKKNIIDHWSMYFKALVHPKGAQRNYMAAQVFLNAPDKRFMIHNIFDRTVPIEEVLSLARDDKEKSAIWLLTGIRTPGKALECISQMYKLTPQSEGLAFLLLREVNKLEDWIYTPHYTNFNPSLIREESGHSIMQTRIGDDRAYAKELLNLISNADLRKVAEPGMWSVVEAYLLVMTENHAGALDVAGKIKESKTVSNEQQRMARIIYALALVSGQAHGNAKIPKAVESTIMRAFEASNLKFVFAVARELEYLGNTTDAAILMSQVDNYDHWFNGVYWKTRKQHHTLWDDTYHNYFFYMDAQYTTDQLSDLIKDVEQADTKGSFNAWKYRVIRKDIPRLYDLLGTKHLRANELKSALANYEKVDDTLWVSSHYYYKNYLDANPFYTNAYNEHQHTKADTVAYNKESIVRTLMAYLAKAENPNIKDRDYYYFLVANCYLNMTQYGNSWMMKRYHWTAIFRNTQLEDDREHYSCDYAKQYYLKAMETSKSPEFAALCLRMAGRCEGYALSYKYEFRQRYESGIQDRIFKENRQYATLKKKYSQHYEELMGNCESFDRYFEARRRGVRS